MLTQKFPELKKLSVERYNKIKNNNEDSKDNNQNNYQSSSSSSSEVDLR